MPGATSYTQYLIDKGMLKKAIEEQQAAPHVPQYTPNTGALVGRGGVNGGPALNRQYAAPRYQPAPPTGEGDPMYSPPVQSQPTTFVPPYGMSMDEWNNLAPDDQAAMLQDAQNGGMTPAGGVYTPQQIQATQQDLAAQPAITMNDVQSVASAIGHGTLQGAGAVLGGVASIPIITAPPTTGGGGQFNKPAEYTVGDAASAASNNIAEPVMNLAGAPEQKWYDMQMQAAIDMANNGGDMPLWAKIAYGDLPGQNSSFSIPSPKLNIGHDGFRPTWNPEMGSATVSGGGSADDKWFLPSWLQAHPEDLATVQKIAADATAAGQDPKEAVGKWWEDKQGLLLNIASRGINDPLNAVGGLGVVGHALESGALGAEVLGDVNKANRLRTAGAVLSSADKAVNAPWELVNDIVEKGAPWARRAAGVVPDNLNIFAPSANQVYRDTEAAAGTAVDDAARIAQARAEGEGGMNAEDAIRQTQAQGYVVGDAPVPTNPNVGPQPINEAAGTIPEAMPANPNVGPVPATDPGLTSVMDAVPQQPGEMIPPPPGVGPIPDAGAGNALPAIPSPDYTVPGAPARIPPPESGVYTTASGGEHPVGWSAKKSVAPPADLYGRDRLTTIAEQQYPEQAANVDAAMKAWRETEYEPMRNAATTEQALDWPGSSRITGMNKTLTPILDGDYYSRYRMMLESQGVDTTGMSWVRDPRLQAQVVDEGLVGQGMKAERTFKERSMQADMDRYIFDPEPSPGLVDDMKRKGIIRTTEGRTEEQRAAKWRYDYANQVRERVHATHEEIQRMLDDAGVARPKAVPNAEHVAKMADAEAQRAAGNVWGSKLTETYRAAPPEVQAEVSKRMATYADQLNYDTKSTMTARRKMLVDAAYDAELNSQMRLYGIETPPVESARMLTGFQPGMTDNAIYTAIHSADQTVADDMIRGLQGREGGGRGNPVISKIVPDISLQATDPAAYARMKQASSLYDDIHILREQIHGARAGVSDANVNLRLTKLETRGRTSGWEVSGSNGYHRTFSTKQNAQAFIDGVNANGGVYPWHVEHVRGGANSNFKAVNELTGETRVFRGEEKYGTKGVGARRDAEAFVDEQNAASGIRPLSEFGNAAPNASAPTILVPDKVPRPTVAPIHGPYTTRVTQEQFEEIVGRKMAPPSLGDMQGHGDAVSAEMFQRGAIDKEQLESVNKIIHQPAKGKRAARDISVMDLYLEKMLEHEQAAAKRAVGTEVAEANRTIPTVRDAVTGEILNASGITRPETKAALRAFDEVTGFVKENLLLSPARVGSAGMLDAFGNGMFQAMTGHIGVAAKTMFSPTDWWSLARHNMRGVEYEHATIDLVRQLGMDNIPHGVADLSTTRELFEIENKTRLERLIGKVGVPEDAAGKLSGVFATKWGRAFRHAIDQNARLNLFGDTIRQVLRDRQAAFLIHVRSVVDNPDEANRIIRELGWNEQKVFSPEEVRLVTGRDDLPRQWRAEVKSMSDQAKAEVNRVHFSSKMTRADEVAKRIFMFHYWQSRALLFYPKTVLGNPYLLNLHYKMWNELSAEADKQGVSSPMNLFFKYMGGDGGMYALFDPIQMVIPYTMFRDMAQGENQSAFDKWTRRLGLFVNPIIQAAFIAAGWSDNKVDLTGTTAMRNLVTSVYDFARNNGIIDHPGISGDPVQHFQDKVLDAINGGVRYFFPDQHDYQPQDLTKTARTTVNQIIIANAERDFGVPFNQMTPEQREEVLAAQIAVMSGQDDNDRANEAMGEYSKIRVTKSITAALPTPLGNTQIRSEDADANRDLISGYYTKKDADPSYQPTPAEQNALDASAQVNAGSPQAATLNTQVDELDAATTDYENSVGKAWNTIAYDQIDPDAVQTIGGKEYMGWQINAMTTDQRMKLADAYILDYGEAATYKSYKAKRDKVIAANPDLQAYREYQKTARNYNGGETYTPDPRTREMIYQGGGVRDFRKYLEGVGGKPVAPQFAAQLQEQRRKLQQQGYSGEELESRLDQWASSADAYNAYRGVRDKVGDREMQGTYAPENVPAPIPGSDPTSSSGGSTGGGSASTGSSTSGTPKMPQYQVDLVAEWDTYQKAITAFEAEHGPISNYSYFLEQNPKIAAKLLPTPSGTLSKYLKWSADQMGAGQDGSMDAYLAKLDADYAAKHPKKDTSDPASTPTPFVPAWQQAS